MKKVHRKSLWMHSIFSLVVCLGLLGIILIGQDISTTVLISVIALYILGNAYLHVKRNDYERETLVEYVLVGAAVFIVIASAAAHI